MALHLSITWQSKNNAKYWIRSNVGDKLALNVWDGTRMSNALNDLLYDLNNEQDIANIPVEQITADPDQPRKSFSDASIAELAQSIEAHGILQPILVYLKDDRYIIIAGERRFRACQKLGLASISCKIMHYKTEMQKMEVSLIENIQRENLNAIDLALSFQALMQKFDLTQDDIAQKVAKSRSYVANIVRLLNLPMPIQEAMRQGKLSFGHAKALMGAEDPERYLEEIFNVDMSVRDLEKKVRERHRPHQSKNNKPETDQVNDFAADLEFIRDSIEQRLSLPTTISLDQKGGGKIMCTFENLGMLDHVLQILGK
jgi:ParB family chromosome partitioning protein